MSLAGSTDWILISVPPPLPGVAEVIPNGGDTRQFQVVADPVRMASFDVTLAQLMEAVGGSNENTSAGFYVENGQEFLIHGRGRVREADDIGAAVVTIRDTVPVLVRDIGTVQVGPAIKRGDGSHNARPAVIIGIQKQPGANTLQLTEQIDATLADIQRALPQGMMIHRDLFRGADFIEQSLHNLFRALLEGRDGDDLADVIRDPGWI